MTDLLFTDHPADGVNDITLATSIGTDNPGDTGVKVQHGLIRETFKALNF
jgi:hypothetical protein